MKKIYGQFILSVLTLIFCFCLVDGVKAAVSCNYIYEGFDNNESEEVVTQLQFYDVDKEIQFVFKYDSDDPTNSLSSLGTRIKTSKLKEGSHGINLKIYLDEEAATKIKEGSCPTYASYIRNPSEWYNTYPKVCLSEDEDYCNNVDDLFINMNKPKANVKSLTCPYTITDNLGKTCDIQIKLDEYKNGYIKYKGSKDSEYKDLVYGSFTCNFMSPSLIFSKTKSDPVMNAVTVDIVKDLFISQSKNMTVCPELNEYYYESPSQHHKLIFGPKESDEGEGNGDDGTLVDNCNTVPQAIIEYINDALKLLRWVALALMIILGVLDFVKAAAADDQDALKKAWQRFTKRLIAVIILFLLPMLVDLILELAGLNNDCENLKIQ